MMSSFKRLLAFTVMSVQTVHKANLIAVSNMQQQRASDKMKEEASDL